MLPDALTTPSDEGQAPATSDNRTADQLLDAAASAGTTVDKPSELLNWKPHKRKPFYLTWTTLTA